MSGIGPLDSRGTAVADSALAAMNPQHVSVRSPGRLAPAAVCHVCHKMIEPGTSDNTGVIHLNCGTRIKGKVYTCGMCGEQILHYGNGKVHVNCRTLRDSMGEGEAKRYLHEAVGKRGQKRVGVDFRWASTRQPRRKVPKADDHRPPLPPPYQLPVDDSDSTDEDMPALVDNPYVLGDTTLRRIAAERAGGCSRGYSDQGLADID